MLSRDPGRYHVVDVFTDKPLEGNPLAVFPNSARYDGDRMQKIARELNLSETVFIMPATRSDCAARLRIFTPMRELPFAGHPTVGASYVMLKERLVESGAARFVLEEGVGPVPVQVEQGEKPLIWLTTPAISFGPAFSGETAAQALGLDRGELLDIPPQVLTAGNPFIFIALRSREAVDRAWLDASAMRRFDHPDAPPGSGVFVFTPTSAGAYSRMFGPDHGISEDPATGSATGPLAAYMLRHELVSSEKGKRFISEQGTKMGRRSILHIRVTGAGDAQVIEVGGNVTPFAQGNLEI